MDKIDFQSTVEEVRDKYLDVMDRAPKPGIFPMSKEKDPAAENFFKQNGLRPNDKKHGFEYQTSVSILDIDLKTSWKDQNRFSDVEGQAYVDSNMRHIIGSALTDHSAPVVWLWKDPDSGNLILIDGRHRAIVCVAMGYSKLNAYILHCTEDEADRIRIESNHRHGLGTSEEDRMDSAIQSVKRDKVSVATAAHRAGISVASLQHKLNAEKVRNKNRDIPGNVKNSLLSHVATAEDRFGTAVSKPLLDAISRHHNLSATHVADTLKKVAVIQRDKKLSKREKDEKSEQAIKLSLSQTARRASPKGFVRKSNKERVIVDANRLLDQVKSGRLGRLGLQPADLEEIRQIVRKIWTAVSAVK